MRYTWLFCLALIMSWGETAEAFTIASAFSKSCHERLSEEALAVYLEGLSDRAIALPRSDTWKGATGDVRGLIKGGPRLDETLRDEALLFAAVSLYVGLRQPDTQGHSVTDLNALRTVHADPSAAAQYTHALRATSDTGPEGDLQALLGTRELVGEHLQRALDLFDASGSSQNERVVLYVEHYGQVEIDVWGPAFRVGLALHAIQDSFSHSIRTEDGAEVLHVLNYVDAFRGHLDEEKSGIAHSTGMDNCERDETRHLVQQAKARSVALVIAVLKAQQGDGSQAISAGLADCPPAERGKPECGWFAYQAECQARILAKEDLAGTCCSADTDFCNAKVLDMIRATPTRAYIAEAVSCGMARSLPRNSGNRHAAVFLAWLLVGALAIGRRRITAPPSRSPRSRRRPMAARPRTRHLISLVCLLSIGFMVNRAQAQENFPATPVLRLEGHGSLLTDASHESVLNISYGPALRGGYRFRGGSRGQWGFFVVVERDVWVAVDFGARSDPGALNMGLGAELLYYGFLRSAVSVGPSILVFDAAFHDAGSVGIFTELHPLGAQVSLGRRLFLSFDPLSVSWVNPTPEGGNAPSVGHLQYRSTLGIEWRSVAKARPYRDR